MVEDIFNEIDGDLRAERNAERNRKLLIGAALLLVLVGIAVGVWQFLRHQQYQRAAAVAAHYFAAQKDADTVPPTALGPDAPLTPEQKRAADAFASLAASAPEGVATLSRLRDAALDWQNNDHAKALSLWDQVGHDRDADADLRGLGTLLWVQHQVDDAEPGLLKARLHDLEEAKNPWRLMATELDALIDLRIGHVAEARSKLTTVSQDPAATEGERQRAGGILDTLEPAKLGG